MTRTYPERHSVQRPFASDGDEILRAPPEKWGSRKRSQIVIGGPDEVSTAEIAMQRQELQQRNPYAGRANSSSVILTDEVRWHAINPVSGAPQDMQPVQHGGKPRAAQSHIGGLLTDEMPQEAGRRPPTGFYYNANGKLQAMPSARPVMEDHLNPNYFGALESEPLQPFPSGVGRAHVEGGSAQRTLADAVIFGRQNGSQARAEANLNAATDRPDRRRPGPAEVQFGDRVGEHLAWLGEGAGGHAGVGQSEWMDDGYGDGFSGAFASGRADEDWASYGVGYASVGSVGNFGGAQAYAYSNDIAIGARANVRNHADQGAAYQRSMRPSFSDSSIPFRASASLKPPVRFDPLTRPMQLPGGNTASWLSLERQSPDSHYSYAAYGQIAPRPLRDARGRPLRFGRPQWDVPAITGLRHPSQWVPAESTAQWRRAPSHKPGPQELSVDRSEQPNAPWEHFGYRRLYPEY